MSAATRRAPGLAGPLILSVVLHAVVIVPFAVWRGTAPAPQAPMYKVELIAAPAGERSAGVVRDVPPEKPPEETKAPPKAATKATEKVAAVKPPEKRAKVPTRATENITKTVEKKVPASKAPTAGGGEVGGQGADAATVRTEGIDFPFPGYLRNIVQQIALNFKPKNPGARKAEVFFLIQRDGSVSGFRFITSSGDFAFDLEVQGALEAAKGSFGPLPAGFTDDILPVSFSFDPARLR